MCNSILPHPDLTTKIPQSLEDRYIGYPLYVFTFVQQPQYFSSYISSAIYLITFQVLFWGVRNLQSFIGSSVNHTQIVIQYVDQELTSPSIQNASVHPNFEHQDHKFEVVGTNLFKKPHGQKWKSTRIPEGIYNNIKHNKQYMYENV